MDELYDINIHVEEPKKKKKKKKRKKKIAHQLTAIFEIEV
jgi:hypothetical protein